MTDTASVRGKHLRYSVLRGYERWCTACRRWLLVQEFNRRIKDPPGPPRAWHWFHLCRTCRAVKYDRVAHNGASGLVPLTKVWWIFDEVTQRLGVVKGAEAIGISYDNMRLILYRRSQDVQKRNVQAAIFCLRDLRRENVKAAPKTGRPTRYRDVTA